MKFLKKEFQNKIKKVLTKKDKRDKIYLADAKSQHKRNLIIE